MPDRAEKIPFEPDLDYTSVGSGNLNFVTLLFSKGHISGKEGIGLFYFTGLTQGDNSWALTGF